MSLSSLWAKDLRGSSSTICWRGREVVAVHQHQVGIGQQGGLGEAVERAPVVAAAEVDFIGHLGPGPGLQQRAQGLGGVGVAAGVVGIHVAHAVAGRGQGRREAGGQALNLAAGRAQQGQLVAGKVAQVGAGKGSVLGAGRGGRAHNWGNKGKEI